MYLNNIDFPNQILDAVQDNKLVVFAGAGASVDKPTSLPNFANLAKEIAEDTGKTLKKEPCEVFLCALKAGGIDVNGIAARILSDSCLKHNALHEAIVDLFSSPENVKVVTTNYDQMFEQVLEERNMLVFPSADGQASFGNTDWSVPQAESEQNDEPAGTEEVVKPDSSSDNKDPVSVDDGFVLIGGGTFPMGSPESENWRIDDETQHQVSVGPFYMDPYETTQKEYLRLMGENPSTFTGDDLPVENISWLDAIRYANAKSTEGGLTPVYTITEGGVTWDLSANGYRLPTEAEWEYACRAGTSTPFNTEKSLSAAEANFYGHYPYEIEENYFNNSVLEAKPGEYRQTTIAVGNFEPNAWGLYDMHGNVNEWCWDYYGAYDENINNNPAGPSSGTRHVYRGGGWNDFAKNMRSAYRAAGQEDMHSYNLGLRLARNADNSRTGSVAAGEVTLQAESGGKILIAYFSWGGNTRGIAREIQAQTGADLFEITPVNPYSTDYNTVLMEAQEDQHRQARPELSEHIQNMGEYDAILLGYPNWWASIPMPIASFLEEYDFTGKTIIPFCSHGGGRFGQSLTAIAKLAPDAVMGEGLSVHYSGGSSLSGDVAAWLEANGIKGN